MSRSRRARTDVAIVGMACRFPGANDLVAFWENILGGVDATSPVPPDRWDPASFFDPATSPPIRGGYLADPIAFDPTRHGVMPRAVEGGEPEQFLILDTARAALLDANLPDGPPDGRKVEVVVARGNYFNRGNLTRLSHGRILAQTLAILESLHPEWTPADRSAVRTDLQASLPPFEAATIPGQLTNATAGRVSDRLDWQGASYVVDAASASSLVALDLAVRSLKEGRADLAVVGAVYLEADVDFPLVFDRLGALSKRGQARPFAADADGLLSGEGVGVVVLKRLGDAEREGDRVYAVVRGVGIASDGRGSGLAAPGARGHARAIRRAYRSAQVDPSQVGLIEGHGLGVPAADLAEIRSLRAAFPPARKGRRALGAVSSMIGHAMPAAGMAGLIKTALALHHRVIPPTLHAATNPHPALLRPDSPATLSGKTRPWVHGETDHPRTAGVNAFGFAGINAHAVLQAHSSSDALDAPGALTTWDTEAFFLGGADRSDLAGKARTLLNQLATHPEVAPKDLAYTLNTTIDPDHPARLGLVAKGIEALVGRLEAVIPRLLDPTCRAIRDARGAYFFDRGDTPTPPRVAFLFPGEGSQYPGMLGDLAPHFPEVRELLDTADRIARKSGSMAKNPDSAWPSELLYGQGGEASASDGLWSAEVAVNVVLSAQWGLYRLLRRLQIRPDAVLGHSSGEFLALAASGALAIDRAFEDGLGALGAIFGRLESSGDLPTARLVAVASDRAKVEAAIIEAGVSDSVEVAMDNCPHQVVIAGEPARVDAVADRLRGRGTTCEVLPFARGYHTPVFAPAVGPIRDFFEAVPLGVPEIPVYSCAEGRRMPDDPALIRGLAVAQWTRSVAFRPAIEAMHADGLRVFVDVGARGNLAGFVEDTLRGRPAFAVAANLPRRSGLTQLNHLVASLFAQGVNLDPSHLYARRRPTRIDLSACAPDRPRPEARLAVGFPPMRLSDDLIARLRSQPPIASPSNGDHSISNPNPPESRSFLGGRGLQTPVADGPIEDRGLKTPATRESKNSRFHRNLGSTTHFWDSPDQGPTPIDLGFTEAASDPNDPSGWPQPNGSYEEPTNAIDPAEAVLLDFQRTMTDFLATQRSVVASFLGGDPGEIAFLDAEASSPCHLDGPWAGELVAFDPGRSAVSVVRLDATDDPVAEHHTLGGRRISRIHPEWRGLPVLPFSVMVEMLAEGGARLAPEGWSLVAVRDVRASKWIRYEEDGPSTLELRAEVVPGDDPRERAVRVAIHNRGVASGEARPLEPAVFDGEAVFAPEPLESWEADDFRLEHPRACRFTAQSIYAEQWLFHGPALRAVASIGPIAPGGIEGELRVLPRGPLLRNPDAAGLLLTDPIILDNFTHLLGGWGLDELADDGDVIFPLRMEALTIFGPRPPDGTLVSCRIKVESVEPHRVRVAADLVRPDGSAWMTIRGWEDWRFRWPGRFRDGFRHPDRAFLGEPLDLIGIPPELGAAVWLEPPSDMGRPVWRDVLEHVQLGPDERGDYLSQPGPDLRRTHRLWGRIAAKEAARRIELARGVAPSYPADLIIVPDPLGRPGLLDRANPDRADAPRISIAHVDGVAVALAVVDGGDWAGIDVEPIVGRPPGFEAVAFSGVERAILDGRSQDDDDRSEWSARLWCAKEASAKATGLGFLDGPSGVEVVVVESVEGGTVVFGVELRGELADACPGLANRTIRVISERRGDFIWAWTLGRRLER